MVASRHPRHISPALAIAACTDVLAALAADNELSEMHLDEISAALITAGYDKHLRTALLSYLRDIIAKSGASR
jgi:hypothetical protein